MHVPSPFPSLGRFRRVAIGLALLLAACAGTEPAPTPPVALPPPDLLLPGGFGRYPDERLQAYVQNIGDRLLRSIENPGVRLRFTVTDNPGFAAVVSRSGNVYISRGLLALLQSEAELAAVLAHEIAHHLSGHSRKTETEALSTLSRSEQLAHRIGGRDSREMTLTFTRAMVKGRVREQELEADRLSVGYLVRAGYEPRAAIDTLRLLAQLVGPDEPAPPTLLDDDNYIAPIFRDHPEPGQRIAAIEQEVRGKRNPLTAGETGRDSYLRAIDGLIFDGNGRELVRRGGNLYFPQTGLILRLTTPWRLISQAPGRITMGSRDGRFRFIVAPDVTAPTQAPHSFIEVLARQDPARKPQTVSIGSFRGYRHDGTLGLARGRIRTDAVIIDNRRAQFKLFVLAELSTPAQELRTQTDTLIGGLREMTRTERTSIQPMRVRIRVAGKNVTYRELARTSPLTVAPEIQLRLINRQFPDGEPRTSEAVKIIQ